MLFADNFLFRFFSVWRMNGVKLNCNILCHRLFISVVNILQTTKLNNVLGSATVLDWPPPSSPPKPLPTDRASGISQPEVK